MAQTEKDISRKINVPAVFQVVQRTTRDVMQLHIHMSSLSKFQFSHMTWQH